MISANETDGSPFLRGDTARNSAIASSSRETKGHPSQRALQQARWPASPVFVETAVHAADDHEQAPASAAAQTKLPT